MEIDKNRDILHVDLTGEIYIVNDELMSSPLTGYAAIKTVGAAAISRPTKTF